MLPISAIHRRAQHQLQQLKRCLSTLPSNSRIYIHSQSPDSHVLSYLPTSPPKAALAIGTTTTIPPTPASLRENSKFRQILQSVIKEHATQDPAVQAQAATFASTAGSQLGSGGMFFPSNHPSQQRTRQRRQHGGGGGSGGDGAGGASSQGGMGGAGRGGYIHVSDQRNPPDYGRTAWPEDIFGSLEIDGKGAFVSNHGNYQESGTYRFVTNEGILGLSPYLTEKLVERLKQLDAQPDG